MTVHDMTYVSYSQSKSHSKLTRQRKISFYVIISMGFPHFPLTVDQRLVETKELLTLEPAKHAKTVLTLY